MKVIFLNAGDIVTHRRPWNGIHFTAQNNMNLGKAIAKKVHEISNA